MMTADHSRSAEPIDDRARTAAMGTWGLWLTLLVLAMFVAGLAAAPLYLEAARPRPPVTGQPEPGWPPEGIIPPPMWRALAALALVVVAALVCTLAVRCARAALTRLSTVLVAASGAASTVAVGLLVADLAAVPFRWDEHAYTSAYWVLTGAAITFVGVGVLALGAVLVNLLTGVVDERRHLELTHASVYLWGTLVLTVALLALAHVHPRLVGGP